MANRFWNFVVEMVSGTLAKAEDVNTNLSGIQTGFDDTAGELDQAIQITNAPGTTSITLNAASRALKILTFNADGDVVAVDDMGNWQGNHADAAGTDYNERDLVKDAAGALGLNNIYRCNTSHTSTGDLLADTANWDLVVDVTDVESAVTAAEAAQLAAETAQTAAELAETGAENQLILFTGQYYGPRTTAQETNLDPNGSASTDGDIYFNTDLNRMKVFNGATWQLTTANAVDVVVTDAGGDYATKNVEFALQQNGDILQHISVTQAVDLDAMESDIAANETENLKTHTGSVSAAGVFTAGKNVSGWTSGLSATGVLFVTHSLGHANYTVFPVCNANSRHNASINSLTTDNFFINTTNLNSTSEYAGFDFVLIEH